MKVIDLKGTEKGSINLPKQFSEEYRPDIIKRAVLALQTHKLQPYGTKIGAGARHAAYMSKRRQEYRTSYGRNQARTPRKIMTRQGEHMNRRGANVPNAVGGRVAHPPKTQKVFAEKINNKERKKAIRSALYATTVREIVESRNHKLDEIKQLPIIVTDDIEKLTKTAEIKKALETFGLKSELLRAKEKKVRPGRGKMRGRKYKKKTGPLIVASSKCELLKSANNIPGVEAVIVKDLNAELLAPGAQAGRLTIWSQAALKEMQEKKMFM